MFRPSFLSVALLIAPVHFASALADEMRVTLLGTGATAPRPCCFSASTLVEAGREKLVFDIGRGSTIRLSQKRIPLGSIDAHFITHMHSDHLVGLPDLWLSGWIATPWASRKTPMVLFGPAGTVAMTENLTKAFSEDIRIRTADEREFEPPAERQRGVTFEAHDIKVGVVYERNGVKVSAFEVNHGEKIKPAFGYVIEYDGKKVVLSGDTKYDERVAETAKGADLLIHEVAMIDPALVSKYPSYRDIENHHTSPEDAGRIFSAARPKLAVYTHIISATLPPTLDVPREALISRTRNTYAGPIVIGEDLMSFTISDTVKGEDASGAPITPSKVN